MSNQNLKLALEIAAKVSGRDDISAMTKEVSNIGPVSEKVSQKANVLAEKLDELSSKRDLIDNFNKSAAALRLLEVATAASKAKLDALKQSEDSAGTASDQFAEKERMLAGEVKQLESQLMRQSATHTKLDTALRQNNINVSSLASEQNRLQLEINQTVDRTAQLGQRMTGVSSSAETFGGKVASITTRLLAMAGAYFGINKITESIKEMFSQGDKAELLQTQMNAVMGSIESGEAATKWIQEFARKTPLQLDEVTQTFTRLKAFGLDPMDGSLQAVVDQSYKLGKGFEGVQQVSLALGQAWAKQKLQGDEILQLVEAGVPAWDLLSKATGKNTYELQRLSEQGALGRDVIKQLMDEIGKGAAGSAAANMGTLSGLVSNARDNIDLFYRKVAESGALDWLKDQLSSLNNEVQKMVDDGRLDKYAKQISDFLVKTGESTKGFILNIGGSFDGLINATTFTIQGLRILFNTFTLSIKAAATAAMVPLLGFAKMLDGMAAAAEALHLDGLAGKLRFASGAIKAEFDAFAAAAKEDMGDIADASSKLAGEHKTATNAMKDSMQDASDKSDQTSQKIISNSNDVQDAAAGSTDKVGEFFSKLGIDAEQASGRVGTAVTEIHDGLNLVMEKGNVAGSAIAEALSKGFSSSKNKAEIELLLADMEKMHSAGQLVGDAYAESLGKATDAAKKLSTTNADGMKMYVDLLNQQKAAYEDLYRTTGLEKYAVKVGEVNTELNKTLKTLEANKLQSNNLEDAFNKLGITSTAAFEKMEAEAKAAYDQIANSGDASLEQQQAAFMKYAAASLNATNAAGKLPDPLLASKAAAVGLSGALEKLKSDLNKTGAAAETAAKQQDVFAYDTKRNAEGASTAVTTATAKTALFKSEMIDAGKASTYMGMSISDLNKEVNKQDATIQRLRHTVGVIPDSFGQWMLSINKASIETYKFYENAARGTIEIKKLQTALASNPSETLINRAEGAVKKYKELGEQNLSGLRSAISAARSQMDSLNSSVQSTLNSLRDEMDQMSNNQVSIENRRYQAQVADLNAKLEEARALKDSKSIADMREALQLAQQIHNQKLATISAEKAAAAGNAASNNTTSSNNSNTASSSTSESNKKITVELTSAAGNAEVSVNSESDLNALLNLIKQHGMRTR